MAGAGSRPGGVTAPRNFYGFFAWKAGVGGVAQWVYHHSSTPEHNYVWPAEGGGTVPTLRWEAVREGTKDRAYIEALEQRLKGRTGPVAEAGRALLAEISSNVELAHEDYDAISGGRIHSPSPETIDEWRRRIAAAVVALEAGR